ncbi:MAG TPA: hypothetical protein VMF13_12135, partial [Luteitalea sp.]|nr:hypothetical protein [Luteitalea sp.]
MKKLFLAAAMVAMSAGIANADVVSIDTITSSWTNAVGGSNVNINNTNGSGADSIRWGFGTF